MSDEPKCPSCGHKFDFEDLCDYITYHGEEGWRNTECPNCECKLNINEHVTRWFELSFAEVAEKSES